MFVYSALCMDCSMLDTVSQPWPLPPLAVISYLHSSAPLECRVCPCWVFLPPVMREVGHCCDTRGAGVCSRVLCQLRVGAAATRLARMGVPPPAILSTALSCLPCGLAGCVLCLTVALLCGCVVTDV